MKRRFVPILVLLSCTSLWAALTDDLLVYYDFEELVDDVYSMLTDRQYRRFLLRVAKATRDRYMLEELAQVDVPTMIIWGRNDSITPPFVAEQFRDKLPRADLAFVDQCGHAPPIEQPKEFARLMHAFLADCSSAPGVAPE